MPQTTSENMFSLKPSLKSKASSDSGGFVNHLGRTESTKRITNELIGKFREKNRSFDDESHTFLERTVISPKPSTQCELASSPQVKKKQSLRKPPVLPKPTKTRSAVGDNRHELPESSPKVRLNEYEIDGEYSQPKPNCDNLEEQHAPDAPLKSLKNLRKQKCLSENYELFESADADPDSKQMESLTNSVSLKEIQEIVSTSSGNIQVFMYGVTDVSSTTSTDTDIAQRLQNGLETQDIKSEFKDVRANYNYSKLPKPNSQNVEPLESVFNELLDVKYSKLNNNLEQRSSNEPPPLPERRPPGIKFTALERGKTIITEKLSSPEATELSEDEEKTDTLRQNDHYVKLPCIAFKKPSLPPTERTMVDVLRQNKFFRVCTRAEGEKILAAKRVGAFLFRPSTKHFCVLMVRGTQRLINIPLCYDYRSNEYYFATMSGQDNNHHRFGDLLELIDFYTGYYINGETLLQSEFNDLD